MKPDTSPRLGKRSNGDWGCKLDAAERCRPRARTLFRVKDQPCHAARERAGMAALSGLLALETVFRIQKTIPRCR
jgi:hypothetical protein